MYVPPTKETPVEETRHRIQELEIENAKLRSACAVLYFGSDEYFQWLAENAYSGCASTQRESQNELRKVLEEKCK
jgi:hypothetical protein